MRSWRWLVIMGALLLALPRAVFAHAELVSSTPEAGSTVSAAPTQVSAVFSQKLAPDGSSLAVSDAAGADVTAAPSQLDPADSSGKTMTVALKSGLGAGTYTVTWTAISTADGDTTKGSFTFTLGGASATAQPEASASASQAAAPAANPAASPAAAPAQSTLPATGRPNPIVWLAVSATVFVALGTALRRHARR